VELGANRKIPDDYFTLWDLAADKGEPAWSGSFPTGIRGLQVRLLQVLTGSMQKTPPTAKAVSKATYALVQAGHTFADLGQNLDGLQVDPGVAIAAVFVCLELAASLERELKLDFSGN